MKIVYVAHSISSCWNNGNAHFLRGLLRELVRLGHDVVALEERNGWSQRHLVEEQGDGPLLRFRSAFPELEVLAYARASDVLQSVEGADLVIVHEWVDGKVADALSRLRRRGAPFHLYFHDTHHRAITSAAGIARFDLWAFDAILAFGRSLAAVYEDAGFGGRTFVLHEAADTRLFTFEEGGDRRRGIVWVGNWGDEERSSEITRYLLEPVRESGLPLDVYGVRYSSEGLQV